MSWRGERIGGMSPEQMSEFLAGPWLARLACLKPDGSPYVVPTWYHWDGVAFWLVPRARSAWAHYMARDPRVSLVVDEPAWHPELRRLAPWTELAGPTQGTITFSSDPVESASEAAVHGAQAALDAIREVLAR